MNDLLFEEANMLLAYLRNEYKRIEDELSHMPSGRLTIARSRRWTKWYLRDGEKTSYLPKSESEFASIMARKRFLEAKLQDIKCEIRALTSYIQKHPTICTSCQMLEQGSLYASFLSRFSNYPTEVQQWATADYPQNDFHSESKKFKSISGNLVRSKSELMIDEALYRNGIPFHYDEIVTLPDNSTIAPDFHVYNLRKQRYQYWEHNGMMDHPDYIGRFQKKIATYTRNHILPGIDLIMTFETQNQPLDSENILQKIRLLAT